MHRELVAPSLRQDRRLCLTKPGREQQLPPGQGIKSSKVTLPHLRRSFIVSYAIPEPGHLRHCILVSQVTSIGFDLVINHPRNGGVKETQ